MTLKMMALSIVTLIMMVLSIIILSMMTLSLPVKKMSKYNKDYYECHNSASTVLISGFMAGIVILGMLYCMLFG
jgi:preprotein translocase subunit YajC